MSHSGQPSVKLTARLALTHYLGYVLVYAIIFYVLHTLKTGWVIWDWPALDSYPFLQRLDDPTVVPNDFYANTFSTGSVRSLYVYGIHLLATMLQVEFVFIFRLLAVLLPPVFFAAVSLSLHLFGQRLQFVRISFSFIVTIVGLYIVVQQPFLFGWWSFYPSGTHQWIIALTVVWHALCILLLTSYKHWVVWVLTLLALALHPVMTVLALPLGLAIGVPKKYWWRWGSVGLVGLVSVSALSWLWHDPVHADYAFAHAQHYLPTFFEPSFWWIQFIIWEVILLVLAVYGTWRHRAVGLIAGLSFVYNGVVLVAQYVGVELWQNDFLTLFGPSRGFVFIGFQFLCLTFLLWHDSLAKGWNASRLLMVGLLLSTYFFTTWPLTVPGLIATGKLVLLQGAVLLAIHGLLQTWRPTIWLPLKRLPTLVLPVALCVFSVAVLIISVKKVTSPLEHNAAMTTPEQSVINFYQTAIPADAVSLVPHGALMTYLPIVAERSIVVGGGFPFTKTYWPEYLERLYALYGTPADWRLGDGWIGEKYNRYYHQLSESELQQLAGRYNASYVIRTADAAPLSFPAVYQDGTYVVYQIPEL